MYWSLLFWLILCCGIWFYIGYSTSQSVSKKIIADLESSKERLMLLAKFWQQEAITKLKPNRKNKKWKHVR